jgi:hypothetical protein
LNFPKKSQIAGQPHIIFTHLNEWGGVIELSGGKPPHIGILEVVSSFHHSISDPSPESAQLSNPVTRCISSIPMNLAQRIFDS